jgi:hypothetical protein
MGDNIAHRSKENIPHILHILNILRSLRSLHILRSLHRNMDIHSKHVDRLDDKPGESADGKVHNNTVH